MLFVVSFFLNSDLFLLILEFVFGGYRDDDMDACTMSMGSGKPAGIQPGVESVVWLCRFSPPQNRNLRYLFGTAHMFLKKKNNDDISTMKHRSLTDCVTGGHIHGCESVLQSSDSEYPSGGIRCH